VGGEVPSGILAHLVQNLRKTTHDTKAKSVFFHIP